MPSIDERRAIAKTLRRMADGSTASLSDGEFVDFVEEIVLGGDVRMDPQCHDTALLNRLADLIEPMERERVVAELERELDRVRMQERIHRERAVLVDKLEDENLELKKRLGCFDDVTPPVSWYAAMRERCERLERELVEAYRRQDD